MSECDKCGGFGTLCNACGLSPNPSMECDDCGGDFCAIAEPETFNEDGTPAGKMKLGIRDCYAGHQCIR